MALKFKMIALSVADVQLEGGVHELRHRGNRSLWRNEAFKGEANETILST